MKIKIEVEVPDDFDAREQMWELQEGVNEYVASVWFDDWDEGPSCEDVIDPQGRI
jgi:hypothetical protein